MRYGRYWFWYRRYISKGRSTCGRRTRDARAVNERKNSRASREWDEACMYRSSVSLFFDGNISTPVKTPPTALLDFTATSFSNSVSSILSASAPKETLQSKINKEETNKEEEVCE